MSSTDRLLQGFTPGTTGTTPKYLCPKVFFNLRAHTQAKIIKKSVILFWLLNMAI